jgi:phage/plasmid-like protein (TIGR03299 family)
MPHEVETMFAVARNEREVPWHFGETADSTQLADDVLTSKQAIKASRLDWDVELRDIFTPRGVTGAEHSGRMLVPDVYTVVRIQDDTVLGVVRSRYTPFQNREAFEFTDTLVDSGEAKYETAGSLKGGRIIFLTMKVPNDILIAGEDRHEMYILLRTSHDGTKAVSVYIVMIRVVCMNTLTLATAGALYKWSMNHVGDLQGKVEEARNTLQMSFKYADEFASLGTKLVETKMSDNKFHKVLETIIPQRPKTDEVIENIITMYKDSKYNGYQGTAWGGVNAITEYYEHGRPRIEDESKFLITTDGMVHKYRNQAAQLLLVR